MKCKVVLVTDKVTVDVENGLGLFEADYHANLYKKKNPKAKFFVINEENDDIEGEY